MQPLKATVTDNGVTAYLLLLPVRVLQAAGSCVLVTGLVRVVSFGSCGELQFIVQSVNYIMVIHD
jgi:hypothetical protein